MAATPSARTKLGNQSTNLGAQRMDREHMVYIYNRIFFLLHEGWICYFRKVELASNCSLSLGSMQPGPWLRMRMEAEGLAGCYRTGSHGQSCRMMVEQHGESRQLLVTWLKWSQTLAVCGSHTIAEPCIVLALDIVSSLSNFLLNTCAYVSNSVLLSSLSRKASFRGCQSLCRDS